MAKFRFHRGPLQDSLSTEVEVNSKEELIQVINKSFPDVRYNDIEIGNSYFDKRTSRITFFVLDKNKNVIGMYTE